MTCGLEVGAGRGAGSGFGASAFAGGAAVAGAALAAGFASSSEMMRLIDARISSIEGSCAFAGCVISHSALNRPPQKWRTSAHHHESLCDP